MKVVVGLGNPGPEYDDTRHNVGWWAVDRMVFDWQFGAFERAGSTLIADGEIGGHEVRVVKPITYVNRSGQALAGLGLLPDFEIDRDLLIVLDDTALDVGRIRLRSGGGSGGHNGLKSLTRSLGTEAYARLRIGVGAKPPGKDRADWVLEAMSAEDEGTVVELLPTIAEAARTWVVEGIEAAMNGYNR
ncbi:MAG: aminoacyl-tRNA hydrolase [Gemmatimonadota bacterium]|nr:aminoacyl-tRNA hydrolase [Gemmatimonadota bacterium]